VLQTSWARDGVGMGGGGGVLDEYTMRGASINGGVKQGGRRVKKI